MRTGFLQQWPRLFKALKRNDFLLLNKLFSQIFYLPFTFSKILIQNFNLCRYSLRNRFLTDTISRLRYTYFENSDRILKKITNCLFPFVVYLFYFIVYTLTFSRIDTLLHTNFQLKDRKYKILWQKESATGKNSKMKNT